MDYINQIQSIAKNNKYTKWYVNLMSRALCRMLITTNTNCVHVYVEKHHILPKSFGMGGVTDRQNIVVLTAKEHYIAHLLLTRMFDGKFATKMNYAFKQFMGMHNQHQQRYTSRLYDRLKRSFKTSYAYIRLYKDDAIKYIHINDIDLVDMMIHAGWQTTMTEEYKKGRVGNMKGKRQSDYQKARVSETRKKTSLMKPMYRGVEKIMVDVRQEDINELTQQGWSLTSKPEYRSRQSMLANKSMSKQSRQKAGQSISNTWKTRPLIVCPHCQAASKSATNMKRWHFDNCKLRS